MSYYHKDLDDIGFKLHEPCEELKPYIYNYWSVKGSLTKPKELTVLSDASLGFVINFATPFKFEINDKEIPCNSKIILMGQTKYPTIMGFQKTLNALGIRFKVGAAYRFFDESIGSFCNKVLDYSNSFWDFETLYKNLEKVNDEKKKIELIEKFLLKRLKLSKKKNASYTFDIIEFIKEQKGDVLIEELSKKFSLSSRQIERVFKKEVGLTVKLYTRVVKMRNVRDTLSSLDVDTLTNTAYDNGYFDQAHFIKEFKFFLSQTPKHYYLNKLNMAQKFNFKKHKH